MTLFRLLGAAALAALVLPAATPSAPHETRPFKSVCTAIPEDPLSPHVVATGSCQSTHLGRESFVASHDVVPSGPPDAGLLPIAVVGGMGTHVAANGDELWSTYGGTGRVDLATGRIEFELDGRYVGGTGRFAAASGTTHIRGVVENGVARYREEGSIRY